LETCSTYTAENMQSVLARRYPDKIGILGGSFNPVHIAHIDIAMQACEQFSLQKVLLIPLGLPPHKTEELASAQDRLEMLRIAIQDKPCLELNPIEIERPGYTYTIDTLTELHRQYSSDTEIHYIIGADTLFELESWKRHEEVFKLCEFICFYRPGYDLQKITEQCRYLREQYGKLVQIARYEGIDVSSTQVREMAGHGLDISALVPEGVDKYIYKKGLYRLMRG
jgi:nicotinate-nucleotide adenylyltransferase